MPEFDQRFLTIHPATALWFEQREKCNACQHSYQPQGNDPRIEGHTGIRCRKTVPVNCFKRGGFKINEPSAYCIDARLEGAPCGPDAALFQPKEDQMNLNEYQMAALRTAKMFPAKADNLAHAALGMITEVGEFATEVKRITIYGKEQTPEMTQHMVEELGDIMWYIALGAHAAGFTLQGCYDVADNDTHFDDTVTLRNLTLGMGIIPAGMSGVALATLIGSEDIDLSQVNVMIGSSVRVIEMLAKLLEVPFETVLITNIDKLRKRFPEKYSDQAAEARADKDGADARSS